MVKVNWDAVIDVKDNRVEIEIIIWDSNGDIQACSCSNKKILATFAGAEALALRRAMILSSELGLHEVLFEGDSQVIIQATKSNAVLCTDYSCIVYFPKKKKRIDDIRRRQTIIVHQKNLDFFPKIFGSHRCLTALGFSFDIIQPRYSVYINIWGKRKKSIG